MGEREGQEREAGRDALRRIARLARLYRGSGSRAFVMDTIRAEALGALAELDAANDGPRLQWRPRACRAQPALDRDDTLLDG